MSQRIARNLRSLVLIGMIALFPQLVLGEVRLSPDNRIVAIGTMAEPLPLDALIRTALIASGTPQDGMERYVKRIKGMIEILKTKTTGNQLHDSEFLLQWMHRNYLRQYIEKQTRLDVLLDTGQFNCVSSGVLYIMFARAIGLEIHGVATSDHALCRLPGIGEGIDVETTNRYGFDPGSRKEARELFKGQTGYAYVPPGQYNQRRDMGEKEFFSLIYQNRISILQDEGHWQSTVGLALDRWMLSRTGTARKEFIVALNNVAAEADKRDNPEEMLQILSGAAAILGEDHELNDIAMALYGNAFTRLWNASQMDDALELLNNSEASIMIPPSYLEEKRRQIEVRLLERSLQSAPFSEAVSALDDALQGGFINNEKWAELAIYLWSTEAEKRSRGKRWIEGWKLLMEAPPRYRDIAGWNNLVRNYEYNTATEYHNLFVKRFREKEWDKARVIVDKGLDLFPAHEYLREDAAMLDSVGW